MQVLTQDWLAQNQFRRYPLADWATLQDTTGTFTLPLGFLVDARLFVPVAGHSLTATVLPYLYSVAGTGASVTVTVSAGGALYSATVMKGPSMVTASLVDASGYVHGHLTFGRSDALADVFGSFFFTEVSAPLLPSLLIPYAPGVTGIRVLSEDGNLSAPLRGEVVLQAGNSVTASGASGVIRLDARVLEQEPEPCECEDAFVPGPPVLTINGVLPDETGNIDLTEGGCVKITPKTAEIEIEDTCSKPCISAKDMDAINALVAALTAQQAGLSAVAGDLMNRVNNLLLPLLAAGTALPEE